MFKHAKMFQKKKKKRDSWRSIFNKYTVIQQSFPCSSCSPYEAICLTACDYGVTVKLSSKADSNQPSSLLMWWLYFFLRSRHFRTSVAPVRLMCLPLLSLLTLPCFVCSALVLTSHSPSGCQMQPLDWFMYSRCICTTHILTLPSAQNRLSNSYTSSSL